MVDHMITLLQLEYFRRLSETEHITQTAKELYISQTALSSMIISLERELGVQLFDRSKRSIHMNEAGRTYLKYVNDIFTALDNGRAALRDMVEEHEHEVSLAMGTSLVWAPMLHAFHKMYPQYALKQFNYTVESLNQALQKREVDLVIAGEGDIQEDGLEKVWIKDDKIYLCVSPNHRFADRDLVYMEELKDEPFISLPVGSPWRVYCDYLFEKAGYSIQPVLECDYTMRAPLIESEFGVALTTSTAREVDLLKPNKYILVADEYAWRKMYLFWNPKRYMSKAARDFCNFCRSYWKQDQHMGAME